MYLRPGVPGGKTFSNVILDSNVLGTEHVERMNIEGTVQALAQACLDELKLFLIVKILVTSLDAFLLFP